MVHGHPELSDYSYSVLGEDPAGRGTGTQTYPLNLRSSLPDPPILVSAAPECTVCVCVCVGGWAPSVPSASAILLGKAFWWQKVTEHVAAGSAPARDKPYYVILAGPTGQPGELFSLASLRLQLETGPSGPAFYQPADKESQEGSSPARLCVPDLPLMFRKAHSDIIFSYLQITGTRAVGKASLHSIEPLQGAALHKTCWEHFPRRHSGAGLSAHAQTQAWPMVVSEGADVESQRQMPWRAYDFIPRVT